MFFCLIQGHDRVLLVVFFLVDASVPFLALFHPSSCPCMSFLFLNDESFKQC